MKRFLSVIITLASVLSVLAQDTFWLGADISGTTALEAHSQQLYNAAGEPRENTQLMKELGLNAVRLRVWVNPKEGFCRPDDVLQMVCWLVLTVVGGIILRQIRFYLMLSMPISMG